MHGGATLRDEHSSDEPGFEAKSLRNMADKHAIALAAAAQVRSGVGHSWRMNRTLEALGLRHHQAEVVKQDSPSLRGQIKHVRHLVEVTPVEE